MEKRSYDSNDGYDFASTPGLSGLFQFQATLTLPFHNQQLHHYDTSILCYYGPFDFLFKKFYPLPLFPFLLLSSIENFWISSRVIYWWTHSFVPFYLTLRKGFMRYYFLC